jgi:hypothetical protein
MFTVGFYPPDHGEIFSMEKLFFEEFYSIESILKSKLVGTDFIHSIEGEGGLEIKNSFHVQINSPALEGGIYKIRFKLYRDDSITSSNIQITQKFVVAEMLNFALISVFREFKKAQKENV